MGIAEASNGTGRVSLDRALTLLRQAAVDVMGSRTTDDALDRILIRCGAAGDWRCAEAWTLDQTTDRLRISSCWHRDERALEEFQKASTHWSFDVGIGLPGLAWARREPAMAQWLRTDSRFRRSRLASEAGLGAALAVPVTDGGAPLAVLVFYAERPNSVGQPDIDVVTTLASQVTAVLRCHRAELELEHRLRHDPVTDLPNREWFLTRVEALLAPRPAPAQDLLAAVIGVDIDRLRGINDAHGFTVGDELIEVVAQRLRAMTGPDDVVASLGGGSFAVLHWARDPESAMAHAHDVHDVLTGFYTLSGAHLPVTVSLGVTLAEETHDARRLFGDAITALNLAKQRGGDQVQRPRREIRRRLARHSEVALALRSAVEDRAIEVHHQRVIDLASGTTGGVEALARWHHPELGTVAPAEFIPVAEQSGLIRALGLLVLEKAVQDLQLLESAAAEHADLLLTVNLSPRQLRDPQLCDKVSVLLAGAGVPPHQVCFELTESVLMDDAEHSLSALEGLHDLGVVLAVDDFGTGYSSLTYLRRFPVSVLKIDRSFVAGMLRDPDDRSIVRSVIDLGHALGLRVVAEGVETEAQHAALLELGCDHAQGFLYGRPAPASELARLGWDLDRPCAPLPPRWDHDRVIHPLP